MANPERTDRSLIIYECCSNSLIDNSVIPEDELFVNAKLFAKEAHEGQKRKTNGNSVVTHLESVAAIVSDFSISPIVLAAAYLHDVVEDTRFTLQDINERFGEAVAGLVTQLTEDNNLAIADRRKKYLAGLISPEAKLISGADKFHNAMSMLASVDFSEFHNSVAETLVFYQQVADLVFPICPQLAIDLRKAITLVEKKIAGLSNLPETHKQFA